MLNRELFGSRAEARVILESWPVEYNERRPHSSLGYRTPEEFAGASKINPNSFIQSNNQRNSTYNLSSFWGSGHHGIKGSSRVASN
jgi:hypothetical protein